MAGRDCPKRPFSPVDEAASGGLTPDECPRRKGRRCDVDELMRAVRDPACLEDMTNDGLGSELRPLDGLPAR